MRCLYRDQPRLEAGDVWYLIDATWYRKWKRYVRWDTMIPRAARPGPIDNRPLLEDPEGDGESLVKANVQEMTDFYIITGEEWEQLLVWYGGGPTIGRPVIAHGAYNSSLSVEYRPLRLYVLKSSDMDNELECYYSKAAKLQQLVDEMCPKLDLDPAEIRVWDYHGEVRTKHLTKLERTLVVSNIIDNQKILFEEKDEDGEFPEKPQSRTVSYSSYGASSSSSWSRWGRQEPQPPGLAGLANLGNTCFMNSSLQSLSNTVPLTAYFLSGRYREDNDVHGDNPLSTGGKLAEQYAELLRAIWDGSHSSIAPRDFKSKLERFAPQFAGYQQHDSQELLAFLLDGLHEDLNKKKRNKPYVEATEAGGRPDPVVAAEAWANHRLRNDSIIVDWFQGQLKSCVTCPECAAVSVTFDPCMYFSLPLPMVTTRKIKITFVPRDGSVPTRYKVTVEKLGSIRDLKRALCKMAGIDEDTPLVVAEVWTHQFYQVYYSDKTGLDSIQENDVLYAYEMDAHDAAGEEEEEEDEEEEAPLLQELDVDVADILYKLRCVLLPVRINREVLMQAPDFWGPMAVVLAYGCLLVWGQFEAMSWVFTVWLCGAFLVFLLARALGGDVSYAQAVGVIGYSLLPLALAVLARALLPAGPRLQWLLQIGGTVWATFSAASLLMTVELAHKRVLLMYPVLLLYVYFASLASGV
mmetsp:Transcript_20550/g.78775  ORF Transcript_20550/g.78775 Transcript_20550/m.78775 type:complete len:692 (+) Transcript_20550:604-2679(+)